VKGVLSYTPGEPAEEGSVAKGEDPKPIAADEMSVLHLGNWVHSAKEILPQGRCTFVAWPPAPEGEEEDESASKAPKYVEVNAQPLRSVHLDSSQGRQLWSASTSSSSKPAVAIARSNVWPGAVAAYNGKRVVNVYVGFGMKSGVTSGVSPVTPEIQVFFPSILLFSLLSVPHYNAADGAHRERFHRAGRAERETGGACG
jgi:hypothetical protein